MSGEKLKELRLKANLTQQELADKIGTFKQKISNWENGVYTISRLYVEKLNEVFGIKN